MAPREDIDSTIVVFYSIAGSAGKSFLASTLFDRWTTAWTRHEGPPTLLVDADLVGASLSRLALQGAFAEVTPTELKTAKSFTSNLTDSVVTIPADAKFLLAAPWVQRAHRDKKDEPSAALAADSRPHIPFGALIEPVKATMRRIEAERAIPEYLDRAQDAQARLARDSGAQRRFWGNLFHDATRRSRRIIVDLPAQGPSGISLTSHWFRVRGDAQDAIEKAACKGIKIALRLVRVLVYASERQGGKFASLLPQHALIQQTIDGITAKQEAFQDIVVVENFHSGQRQEGTVQIGYISDLERASPSPITALLEKGKVPGGSPQDAADTLETAINAIEALQP